MPGVLLSSHVFAEFGDALERAAREGDMTLSPILLPDSPDARLDPADRDRIEIAYFSRDMFPRHSPAFFSASLGAASLRWVHLFNAGTDHPIFQNFLDRGVALTNSSGASAGVIAHTVLAAVLAQTRGLSHWLDQQRKRAWTPLPDTAIPRDVADLTLTVLGLGAIGSEVARLALGLGFRVIGVRRSPRRDDDPIDEVRPPEQLDRILPETDWLVIACPLTDRTRGLIDGSRLALLPPGARVANVARGEVIVEEALIEALRAGRLAGAYLDVFSTEPLPGDSPLWDLPGVWVSPHNSSVSQGNFDREAKLFLANLVRFGRGEPLLNQVAGD